MLDRLEAERRESARRTLEAQEGERRVWRREVHDEVGQTLAARPPGAQQDLTRYAIPRGLVQP